MTTREAAYSALLATLQTAPGFSVTNVTRKQPEWASITGSAMPVLYIRQISESYTQSKGSPGILDLVCLAVLYTDAGNQPDAVKSTAINSALDAIDTALLPDPVSGFQTLNGIVIHAWREGTTQIEEGTLAENALTAAPIHMRIVQDPIGQGVFVYDSGTLWMVPQTNQANGTPSDLTPIRIGNLKGITVDTVWKLNYPSNQLMAKTNAGTQTVTITGRAAIGTFNGRYLSQLVYGQDFAAGAELADMDRVYTIPASPYTVTVTPPSSGSFVQNLGVLLSADGTAFKRISGTPTTGQFSLSGAVYTFAAADTGKSIKLSYLYAIAGGSRMVVSNIYAGEAPSFQMILQGTDNGRNLCLILKKVLPKTFKMPTNLEAFSIPDFEFEAIANLSGGILETNSSV